MKQLSDQVTGGTITAPDFNQLPKEVENLITGTGLGLSNVDFLQAAKAIAAYAAHGDFYTDGGAVDAYVLTPLGSKQGPQALANGLRVRFIPANTNTGAATVNVNGLGVTAIKKADGSTDIAAGTLVAGKVVELVYDGTVFRSYSFMLPAKGDLAVGDGAGVVGVFPVGVDGKILMADSSKALGVNWGPDTFTPQIPITASVIAAGSPDNISINNPAPMSFSGGLYDIYFQLYASAAANIGLVGGGSNQSAFWVGTSQVYNSATITAQYGNITGQSAPTIALSLAAGTLDGHIRMSIGNSLKAHFEIAVANQDTGSNLRLTGGVSSSNIFPYSGIVLKVPGGTITNGGKMVINKIA